MWRISSLGRTKSDIGGLEGCGEDMMRGGCLLRGCCTDSRKQVQAHGRWQDYNAFGLEACR